MLAVLLLGPLAVVRGQTHPERELPLESQVFTVFPKRASAPMRGWNAGGDSARSISGRAGRTLSGLRFRFLYETERDQTCLLTRQFTVWRNGLAVSTVTVPKLIRGDGSSRWETNEVLPVLEKSAVVFKLGAEVLAGEVASDMAVGITRVTLEPYSCGCGGCRAGAASSRPGQPGPLLQGTGFWTTLESSSSSKADQESKMRTGTKEESPKGRASGSLAAGLSLEKQAGRLSCGGIRLRFGLGQTADGLAAGELWFAAGAPNPAAWRPQGLQLLALPGSLTVSREPGSGALRQIGSSQCLAEVCRTDDYGYQLRFYAVNALLLQQSKGILIPTNGLTPFVTWTIENPDRAAATNRLRVIETAGALRVTNTYTWFDAGQRWELVAGNGLSKQVLSWGWDAAHTLLTETNQTVNPADGRVVSESVSRYRRFGWGQGLVEEVTGSGAAARTNRYSYYDSPGSSARGRLREALHADGSWEHYQYDRRGRLSAMYSPYPNTPPEEWHRGRMVAYDYSPWRGFGDDGSVFPLRPRTVTESIGGVVVARSCFLAVTNRALHLRCLAASRVPFDSPVLVTTNWYYPPGQPNGGRLRRVDHPDGTMDLYTYGSNAESRTSIVLSGQPNPAHTTVVDGSKGVTVLGSVGEVLLKEVYDVAPGRADILVHREDYTYTDELKRSHAITYLDGTSNVIQYGCCGLDWVRDRDGMVTLYAYDALKRLKSESRLVDGTQAVTTVYNRDAAGQVLGVLRIGTDGTNSLLRSGTAYDTAGRARFETNALGGVTELSYEFDPEGRPLVTRRYPNGGTRIESFNRDGSLRQVTGTAVHGLEYEYRLGKNGELLTQEIRLDEAGKPTPEWTREYTDRLGRLVKTEYAGGASEESFYNAKGQLFKERDPDGVLTFYGYNGRGEREVVAVRTERTNWSDAIDFAGADRVTRTVRDVLFNPALGAYVQRARVYAWDVFHANRSNLVAATETSVDGLRTWRTVWNNGLGVTNYSEMRYATGAVCFRLEYAPDRSSTRRRYRYGRLEMIQTRDASGATLTQTNYSYDAHNRLASLTDRRTGATAFGYNAADLVTTLTTPAPDSTQPGQATTTTHYNLMLQPSEVIFPDQTHAFTEYHLTGEIRKVSGAHVYPVEYTCDYAGRIRTLRTWKNTADPTTAVVTTWNYNRLRGWLESKCYADGRGLDYEHTPAGRLRARTWARESAPGSGRRLATHYSYNAAGDLEAVSYNGARSPGLSYTYDRRGRLATVTQGNTSTSFAYDNAGQLSRESCTGGPLAGLTLSHRYDHFLRRTNVSLLRLPSTILASTSCGYDSASRLRTVASLGGAVSCSATYSYLADSALVQDLTFKQGEVVRLLSVRRYDLLNRPVQVMAAPADGLVLSFDYEYNRANQPTRATLADCSYWLYAYDPLGQVGSARRFRSDGTPLAGQQFEFDFDHSANRTRAWTGGDEQGANLRPAIYSANDLDQYTACSAAGTSVVAEAECDTFRHDADGNLTNDGHWALTWDAENRLVGVETLPSVPDSAKRKLAFEYDFKGRRVRKTVSRWAFGTWLLDADLRFVYDGWDLVAVLDSRYSLLQSFTWGLDLSSSLQGAGGAGGLLMTTVLPSFPARRPSTLFATYDGYGNLVALINAADGKIAAQYEYGPFGEGVGAVGPLAGRNPFRFATRYCDKETGWLYCAHRYYNPGTGRWLSRDPLNELAFQEVSAEQSPELEVMLGQSLYGAGDYVFVGNMPLGKVDLYGLASSCDAAVEKGLGSRRNRRLWREVLRAGCPQPNISGSDSQGACAIPGYLGEYLCSIKEGKICCANVSRAAEVERILQHELIHALDCCRNGLATCEAHICSEIVAYYMADCEWIADRLGCALSQMRVSLESLPKCAPLAAATTDQMAKICIKSWKDQQR